MTRRGNTPALFARGVVSRIRFGKWWKAVEYPAVFAERDAPDLRIRRPSAGKVVKLVCDGTWSAAGAIIEPVQSDFDSQPTTAFDLLGEVHGGLLPC
jgi:hypothetical protein